MPSVADTFSTLSPDGHPLFCADLPNDREQGKPRHCYVHDERQLQQFIARHDKPGRALYFTVAHLAEGAWRTKDNVIASHWVWTEVDFKDHPELTQEEILRRIYQIPRRPNLIVFSGHGYHLYWRLAEPTDAQPGDAQRRLEEVLGLACNYVGGDESVGEAARLMRLPGSHNTRAEGENIPVEIIHRDDLSCELEDLLDFFLEARPILSKPVKQAKGNGHDRSASASASDGPVDVEACLAAMTYEGTNGTSVNDSYTKVGAALLARGEHPADVLERFVDAVMAMAKRRGLAWDRQREVKKTRGRIVSTLNNLLLKNYDPTTGALPTWLPGEFHERWLAALNDGRRPCFGFNRGGFYARRSRAELGQSAAGKERHPAQSSPPAPRQNRKRLTEHPGPAPQSACWCSDHSSRSIQRRCRRARGSTPNTTNAAR
jgi:hypothetical protein